MQFSHFLSSYYPDTTYPAKNLFNDMLDQARLAEELGYCGVTLPEHHFMNILMNPAPLQMAVKVASITQRIAITTAVLVLPFYDLKRLAGEIAVADILCDGRLVLGVGRGAFAYEFERFGVPEDETRAKFDEAMQALKLLLTQEEVSWQGKYFQFDKLTIMPRPMTQPMPAMMIAALAPEAIYHCAKRGLHVQTTPLQGSADLLQQQADAFKRGVQEHGEEGKSQRLSLLRVAFVTRDENDAKAKQKLAYEYYKRFDNVFTGPGEIAEGAIKPLPRQQSVEELAENLLIGTAEQLIEKLKSYEAAGIHEVNLNMNIGAEPQETLESMHRFAQEVLPHFDSALTEAA